MTLISIKHCAHSCANLLMLVNYKNYSFNFRLFFAERLLEERIPLACINSELGCKFELVGDRLKKHETEECPFGLLRYEAGFTQGFFQP